MTTTDDWDSQNIALGMRDVIASIADSRVNVLRPTPSYAVVQTINREQRSATVLFAGDSEAVTVAMASIEPADIGQTVRIGGLLGHRYIEDVLGDAVVSGMHPASMGARGAPYASDARFGHALGSPIHGFIAHSYGDMSISTAPGRGLYVASDGSGTYAFTRANDHYISPWWMGISPSHGIAALTLWGADQNTGYTLLGGYGNTYINATPAGSIALRTGNTERVNVSSSYCTIYPTISCNAISCASISSNGHAINANGGPIYGGGLDVGAGGITGGALYLGIGGINCGGVNVGTGSIQCGAIYPSTGIATAAACTFGSVSTYYTIRANSPSQGGEWSNAGFLSYASGGLSTIVFHNGTYASCFRTYYGAGDRIEAMNWNQGAHVPMTCLTMTQTSTITVKRDVRSLRPERERVIVYLDPAADTIDQPDVMALRPVVFRHKVPLANADGEVVDGILGHESQREQLGLIAEEVQHIIPSAVPHRSDGSVIGIEYSQITIALLDHLQRLTDEVATLRYRVAELEGERS